MSWNNKEEIAVNLKVPQNTGNFSAKQVIVSFSEGFCSMGLGVGLLVEIGFGILKSDNLIQCRVEIQ
jgi:hypothetical protein